MRTHRRALLGLAVVLALVAVGCGGGSDSGTTPATDAAPSGEAISGGSVTLVSGSVRSLDPTLVINNASQGAAPLNAIYDAMLTVDPVTGEVEPRIATGLTTEDGVTWTLTLNEGVVFSDGTPYDAEAVKFNWDRIIANVRSASNGQASQIESLTVTDPTTLVIKLDRINYQFHRTIPVQGFVWIASPTAIQAGGETWADKPIGAGPFTVQTNTPDSEVVLVKNPTYWQADKGLPKLDALTFKFVNESQSAVDTVTTGAAEGVMSTDQFHANQVAAAGGYILKASNWSGGNNMLFNKNRAPFDDIRARQAVTLALDIQQLIDVVQQGEAEKIDTIVQEESPFYDATLTVPEPNQQQAQDLFDELAAEGKPVTFDMVASAGTRNEDVVKQLQTQLAAFDNVTASVKPISPADYGITLFGGEFDLAVYAVASPDPEPQWWQLSTTYPIPIGSLGSAEADALITQGRELQTTEERKPAYTQLQQLMLDEYAFIWMWRTDIPSGWSNNVTGAVIYGQGSPLFDSFGLVG